MLCEVKSLQASVTSLLDFTIYCLNYVNNFLYGLLEIPAGLFVVRDPLRSRHPAELVSNS